MKDGIYKSDNAIYFVLDNKILMRLMGEMYKTTKSFIQGDWKENLQPGMVEQFDEVYDKAKQW
tara:strand:+ start:851 stop:1039 length:189 start_codon:yes stop_codon:yes gene_type:complete